MKKLKNAVIALALAAGMGLSLAPAANVSAINVFDQCANNKSSDVCKAQGTDNATSLMRNVINTLLFLLGAIAVIMIIIGGIRYVTSGGNAADVKAAKDTVLYSIVGLVVAILAFAIVNFVINAFK